MTSEIVYQGDLRTIAKHIQSGNTFETDAPVDNNGRGERFSPTDLLATSLGACMMTVMGIKARDMNLELKGTRVEITKKMAADPRRVSGIEVVIHFPEALEADEKQRTILERTAITCPVQMSIHPDIQIELEFNWADKA